jgi:phosphoribosylanthranilate isomerase
LILTRVKICGITNLKDALWAADLGAYALGFIFYKESKRYIMPKNAKKIIEKLPPFVVKVGVFVNETLESMKEVMDYCGLDRIQAHNDNYKLYEKLPPDIAIAAFRIKDKKDVDAAKQGKAFPLLDKHDEKLYGGTGKSFDWRMLEDFGRPYILSGGINVLNLTEALKLNPYALDVASGVEKAPGIKDHKKMFEFFKKLRENQG